MSDTQQQIPATTPLTVSLPLQQWRELLEILADGQFRKVSPLIGAIEQQCRSWTLAQLSAALARIAEAAKAARLNSTLEGTLAENLLLDIGAIARDKNAGPPLPSR